MYNAEIDGSILLSDVVSALSMALDLTEGQAMGHSIRSCILGMRIAEELRLPPRERSDLYYALLLKDAGCSSNATHMHQILGSDELKAKAEVKFQDWTGPSLSGLRFLLRNVLPGASWLERCRRMVRVGLDQKRNNAEMIGMRCERGAEIARKIGVNESSALAIRSLDEHWDGGGYPEGRRKEEIPLLARIMNVCQTLEVFGSHFGPRAAVKVLSDRSGSWFDPEIVRVAKSFAQHEETWQRITDANVRETVLQMEPGTAIPATPERIDNICEGFAQVIDAKSPYTFHHSVGVTAAALDIAEGLAMAPGMIVMIRRAALLHDIGKLSVSNSILEKPGALNNAEWQVVKNHPVYSRQILETITGFTELAYVAGSHHERLDGTGYPNGLTEGELTLPARTVAVADVFQALSEKRPYREGLPLETVFEILEKDAPLRLDRECVAALKRKATRKTVEHGAHAKAAGAP
jgi:putative nucleotidyltransferase with HDIG domain